MTDQLDMRCRNCGLRSTIQTVDCPFCHSGDHQYRAEDDAVTNLLRWNEEKAERIAALEQQLADSDLVFNHADECVGKYMADADALRAEVARLSAPMSEEEMNAFPWLSKKVAAARFDLIIAARRA